MWDSATNELKEYRVLGLGKGAELGASIAIELNGSLYCPLHDHRGNIISLIDAATAKPAESYRYTAYGEHEVYNQNHEQIPMSALNNPWGFASKRLDPETGFVYFSRRYYAPVTGRWITPDPLGFADGPNMYAYVHGNPMTRFDLYGLFTYEDEYDVYDGVGLYGMLEASARTAVDFGSWAAYCIRGKQGYQYVQDWHNTLDGFRDAYVEQVASMPGNTASVQQLHQALEVGVFARDTFDFSRMGIGLAKQIARKSASLLSAVEAVSKKSNGPMCKGFIKKVEQRVAADKTGIPLEKPMV